LRKGGAEPSSRDRVAIVLALAGDSEHAIRPVLVIAL